LVISKNNTSGLRAFTLSWNTYRSLRSPQSKQITWWVVPWSSMGLLPAR
jgi:hypothetical protein